MASCHAEGAVSAPHVGTSRGPTINMHAPVNPTDAGLATSVGVARTDDETPLRGRLHSRKQDPNDAAASQPRVRRPRKHAATPSDEQRHRVPNPEVPPQVPPRVSAAAARLAFLHAFREETWTMNESNFREQPAAFTGPPPGPNFPIHRMPAKLALFSRFWSDQTVNRVCQYTNRYASEVARERQITNRCHK